MILFLTAGFGDGHNTAARNCAHALERLAPNKERQTLDLFDVANPWLSKALKAGYQMLITRLPSLWKWTYLNSRALKFSEGPGDVLWLVRSTLFRIMEKLKPEAVVSTYPLYARMLEQIRAAGGPSCPLFTVVTDSISIHPTWALGTSNRYYVADEASAESLAGLGVSKEKICVSGFPVSLDFMMEPENGAGRGGSEQKILYLPSTGLRHVSKTLEALAPVVRSGVKLTLPAGKHLSRLYHTLNRFGETVPENLFQVIGWTNRIPSLLQTHDLVICKAGGGILHESLAARCPAIIDYVVPGQEEGNADLLTTNGCGIRSYSPKETGELTAKLLANGAAEARRMSENAKAISEPGAAMKIVSDVLSHLGQGQPTA